MYVVFILRKQCVASGASVVDLEEYKRSYYGGEDSGSVMSGECETEWYVLVNDRIPVNKRLSIYCLRT